MSDTRSGGGIGQGDMYHILAPQCHGQDSTWLGEYHPLRTPTAYFLAAVDTVRENKARYAEAEAAARLQRPERPSWFSMMGAMMAPE